MPPPSDIQFGFSILFASIQLLNNDTVKYGIKIQIPENTQVDCKFAIEGNVDFGNNLPYCFLVQIQYTRKISPPFYFRPLNWVQISNWANSIISKGLFKKIGEWANSRRGVSVSDPYRAKIRTGDFKAIYSNPILSLDNIWCILHNSICFDLCFIYLVNGIALGLSGSFCILIQSWILLILRSRKGGCCSISDDLSCS